MSIIESIETLVRLSISDGEYIGRHQRDMEPAAVIDLREHATAERLKAVRAAIPQWQPIDTAPVEEWTESTPSYFRFGCLLQNESGTVFEGYGYYVVKATRTGRLVYLRWNDGKHQCFPKYWMPLPAPKVEA